MTLECAPERTACITGDFLRISNATIFASTSSPTFLASSMAAEMRITDLVGRYLVKSERDGFGNVSAIHIGSIEWGGGRFATLALIAGDYRREVALDLAVVRGVIVALAQPGTFGVEINGRRLCHDNHPDFAVEGGVAYFASAGVCVAPDDGGGLHVSMQVVAGISVGAVALVVAVVIIVVSIRKRRAAANPPDGPYTPT
jgi:hypothetical protein